MTDWDASASIKAFFAEAGLSGVNLITFYLLHFAKSSIAEVENNNPESWKNHHVKR